ncbi:squalene/phytoene synthase family protein [Phenylobacterium sp.]|uniref:squalene/phytoene synthase family protein n=1 Tax=Phenylobacterium sp. TaxID=1871053 RepID=UPI00121246D6|nr:squalene/phytoene synthase family protein [Phenylobacterium sp.]TAL32149.1 MAG: phytoene/squalene synthase family protein [Phenylobacterium sp.]
MSDDLDDLIRRVDPDRWLSSRFIGDAGRRADVIAIYAYDHELARAPKVASNPLLGEIRLTWWREMLDEAYEGRHVRHHPTAQALADVIRRHDLPREPLEAMIDARYRELDATPMSKADAMALAFGTANSAAVLAIQVLGGAVEGSFASGWSAMWALSRLMADGRLASSAVSEALAEVSLSMAEARTVERRDVSHEAFPAVAHATLAPHYATGRRPTLFEKQLRLIWAVARGRI